jgi:predicted RNA binding protein YcfA (HicA-like mRNA interferase family)
MTANDVDKILEENGWVLERKKGSHHIFVKEKNRPIPVPHHGDKDLGDFAKELLKEAGIRRK